MPRVPLVGPFGTLRSLAASAETCCNLYPEGIADPQERLKGGGFLVGTPGKSLFSTLPNSPIRGVWSGGGRLFVAAGTRWMELDSGGNVILGPYIIADDAAHSPVQFFANGNQLFIVSAGLCYVSNGGSATQIGLPTLSSDIALNGQWVEWTGGDTFPVGLTGSILNISGGVGLKTVQQVLSPTLLFLTTDTGVIGNRTFLGVPSLTAQTGAFLDGYFICNQPNTKQFSISPLLDGTNQGTYIWNALDFAVKESYPDYIRGILVSGEQLYLFGSESFEVWQNTGGSILPGGATGFPFERIDGATGKYGVTSPWAMASVAGRVFFLGGDATGQATAYEMVGWTPRRISTHAEEETWGAGGLGSTAVTFGYQEDGHDFWVINFGVGKGPAYVFDLTTGLWHTRSSSGTTGDYGTQYHTFVTNEATSANNWGSGGKHITGGPGSGTLYQSSINLYSEAGADITRQRAIPYLYNAGNRMYFGRQTLEMDTGTVSGGAAPNVVRDYSDDRGHNFVNPQSASMGTNGEFSKRVFWPVCGSSRDRVFRYTVTSQAKVNLVSLDADVTNGVN